jgi:hypothetical protein
MVFSASFSLNAMNNGVGIFTLTASGADFTISLEWHCDDWFDERVGATGGTREERHQNLPVSAVGTPPELDGRKQRCAEQQQIWQTLVYSYEK